MVTDVLIMVTDVSIYDGSTMNQSAILRYTPWMIKFIRHCETIDSDAMFDSIRWGQLVNEELRKFSALLVHTDEPGSTCLRFENEEFFSIFLLKFS